MLRLYMIDSAKISAARSGREEGDEQAAWKLVDDVLTAPSIAISKEDARRLVEEPIEQRFDRRIGLMRKLAVEQGLRVVHEDGESILLERPLEDCGEGIGR